MNRLGKILVTVCIVLAPWNIYGMIEGNDMSYVSFVLCLGNALFIYISFKTQLKGDIK